MRTTRLARRLGLDGNPLRRRTDKIAACLAALLLAVFLIGAPVLSVRAVGWAGHTVAAGQQAARSWRQVSAVLLRAARPPGGLAFELRLGSVPVDRTRWADADRSDRGEPRLGGWPHRPAVGGRGGLADRSPAQPPWGGG